MGLGGILDHPQTVALGELEDRIHVDRMTVEMHDHDAPGARRDRLRDPLRIHVPRARLGSTKTG